MKYTLDKSINLKKHSPKVNKIITIIIKIIIIIIKWKIHVFILMLRLQS